MGKKKTDERKRQRKAEKKKSRRDKRKAQPAAQQRSSAPDPHALWSVSCPDTSRCHPPVHFDAAGHVLEDARALLGLGAGPLTEAEIREAWRKKLIEHPPEQDPEGARKVREARDRLLDPERVFERLLGELRVPDAAAYGLSDAALAAQDDGTMDAMARLGGQAMLYALVEDALLARQEA